MNVSDPDRHLLCLETPCSHSPSKLMLRHPRSHHHEATVLRNLCERNSFSAARFWPRGHPGMLPGKLVSDGVARHPSEHRAGMLGASKRFCDTCPPPTSSEVEIIMYTQQSRRPHPVCVNAKLQKTACSSSLDLKSTHTSKLLEGIGDEKHTCQHEYFNIYQ